MKNFFKTVKGRVLIVVVVCLCVLAVFLVKNADTKAPAAETAQSQGTQEGMPVFVEFGADWCTYCKQMQPILEELEQEYAGKLEFQYVDIDEDPETAQQFGVTSVPYYALVDAQGNVQLTYLGATTKETLQDFIREGLGISA